MPKEAEQLERNRVGGIVEPGVEEKSGCYWCPLFPFSRDFNQVGKNLFRRDADKIQEKNRDGHVVESRCVTEDWTPVKVLFVSEAPGKYEDKQGKPFVGGPGGL